MSYVIGNARRKVAVAALAALAAASVTACGSEESSQSAASGGAGAKNEKVSIAFFGYAAANAYTQAMYKAVQEDAKDENVELTFFDGKFDGQVQRTQIQDAITSAKFDGFLIMPNDNPGTVPVANQAIAKGIKVVALQTPIGTDTTKAAPQIEGITTSVIEDVIAGGRVTAESVNAVCKDVDPCEVGVLWGDRKISWEAAKVAPFNDALEPNVKVVAEADAGFLQGPGQKATADMLRGNPGLDVVATPSGDQMTLGGERAIESAGKKEGEADGENDSIAVIGYAASVPAVERVRSGKWYSTYALIPATMAKTGLEYLLNDLRGEPVPSDGVLQSEISPVGVNVTREVLDEHPDFSGEWVG